ncbi:FadR/GntR family transcriptional regulator [Pueribacillus sp. YX66]|uniref:FadR/GntR family transcriptional regulator n=1 Tax=Pueribacillus sp. YX66 TaxID=3229242 RepID=UPI00358D4F07
MLRVEQVQTKKMSEDVAEQIKKIISDGDLKPGDKLPSLRSLAESFQVGQSTIREAFSVLKTIGLIETRQGEGTFVRAHHPLTLHQPISDFLLINKDDMIDLLDVRKMLERGTVALAAKRRTDDDLRKIESVLKQMENDLHSESFGEDADWAFHFAIAEASRNKIVISLMEELSTKIKSGLKASRLQMYVTPGMPEQLLAEHRNIFIAIQEQNVEEAEKYMVNHLVGVREQLIATNLFEGESS